MAHEKIRLQKYLADCGVASRRQAEMFIVQGKVKVNGKKIVELGTKVGFKDRVEFEGKIIKPQADLVYVMLNKPVGYLSTVKKGKEQGQTVLDLVRVKQRIFPVGRLDKDSSGLLLLTNDGELALRLAHPRYEKEKEYLVEVDQPMDNVFLKAIRNGVRLDDSVTLPAKITLLSNKKFSIVIKQGKKRQIRRMCQVLGSKVLTLHRIRIKNLTLGNLKSGKYIFLTQKQLKKLQ